MNKISDTNTVAKAGFFKGLCEQAIFIKEFLTPLDEKRKGLERTLLLSDNVIDIHRAQGAMKLLEDLDFLLMRHQDKLKSINKELKNGNRGNSK